MRVLDARVLARLAAELETPHVIAEVRAMLGVLGLDPLDPHWAGADHGGDLHGVVDSLVRLVLEGHNNAYATKSNQFINSQWWLRTG